MTEREQAEEDARFEGIGFLVDGKRVHPKHVVVIRSKSNDADMSIAIGEHAFKAGYSAGSRWADKGDDRFAARRERAWSEYTPPEDLCGESL